MIDSLYLDTPALAFHQAKERGDPERLKLRIRTYPKHSPAVLELKRKVSDVIDKTRAVVDRKLVEDAAKGLAPARDDTACNRPRFRPAEGCGSIRHDPWRRP